MRTHIVKAMEQFFHETLSIRCEEYEKFPAIGIYTSLISISDGNTKYSFSLCMREETLYLISKILLDEDNPDEETKVDLVCECANLIIGSAKVLIEAEKENKILELSPPEYQGYFEEGFSKVFDEKLYFKVKDELIMIGIEMVDIKAMV